MRRIGRGRNRARSGHEKGSLGTGDTSKDSSAEEPEQRMRPEEQRPSEVERSISRHRVKKRDATEVDDWKGNQIGRR